MKFKLEIDDERPLAGWAFLLFHNSDPGFLFVDRLNKLYDYAFERFADMELSGVEWPFYYFDDEPNGLKYFLLQRPATVDAPWSPLDKLLLIKGEESAAVADEICDDFADTEVPDPTDLLAAQRAAIIGEMQSAFTFVSLLDFDRVPTSRAAAKERAAVEDCCNRILSKIEERHLDLSRAERLRIELEKRWKAQGGEKDEKSTRIKKNREM